MKLNNKGWGTLEMFLLSGALLLTLLFVVIMISSLYGSYSNSTRNKDYFELENRLVEAAKKYVVANNIDLEYPKEVSYNTLYNSGYITDLLDSNGHSCNGYVRISKEDIIPLYKAYIECRDYQTKDF